MDLTPGTRIPRLPEELGADLPDTGSARLRDDSEARVVDVSARIRELRVVEDVEKFTTDFKCDCLLDVDPLREPKVGVIESRAMEEAPVGRPESAEKGAVWHWRRANV